MTRFQQVYEAVKSARAASLIKSNAYLQAQSALRVAGDGYDSLNVFVEKIALHAQELEELDNACAQMRSALLSQEQDPSGYHAATRSGEVG